MDTRWSGEAKYQTLLAVSQAANSQRDLSSVLQAVADALEGLVPVDLIGVVTHGRETVRARAVYFRGASRGSGENQAAYVRRFSEAAGATGDEWKHTPFLRDAMERDRQTLVLDHGEGVTSLLCHLGRAEVRDGDRVEARAVLGVSGTTGIAASPHVHWGVYIHGAAVDPGLLAEGLD